ncbi:SDR family NAD(P)-dependent oxidoreductase [Streptomyces sp. NPDC087440]|uniref:SDR family NAD(P)-dependent oxidoreductase n=1 Tax=Streptomyces sp. NPDC087440 TaxID=3365790 RepID=UPI0037F37482
MTHQPRPESSAAATARSAAAVPRPLAGKTALVVGGTSGMGAATARALAAAGATVTVAGRRVHTGRDVADRITASGGTAHALTVDVTDEISVRHMFDQLDTLYEHLDIAVNCAGTIGSGPTPLHRIGEPAWHTLIGTNLTGCWRVLSHEARRMLRRRSGSIVNFSSVLGLTDGGAYPGMAAYAAAKHGIVGLTKAAAAEYGARGLRVNAVCPSFVRSDMLDSLVTADQAEQVARSYPLRRIGEPEEIAATVVFLASDAAAYLTGQAIAVDGGYTVR